jgi:hypothetical protein
MNATSLLLDAYGFPDVVRNEANEEGAERTCDNHKQQQELPK